MKTYSSLSRLEKDKVLYRSAINYNHTLLNQVLNFVYSRIDDLDVLQVVSNKVDALLLDLDSIISNSLGDENECKTNSSASPTELP